MRTLILSILLALSWSVEAVAADAVPAVISQTTGRTQQLQAGDNMAIPSTSTVGFGSQPVGGEVVNLWSNLTSAAAVARDYQGYLTYTSSGSGTAYDAQVQDSTNTTFGHLIAYQGNAIITAGSANAAFLADFYGTGSHAGSGTVTAAYNYYAGGWGAGGGTITNRWMFFGAGADPSYMGGDLYCAKKLSVGTGVAGQTLTINAVAGAIAEWQLNGSTFGYITNGSTVFSGSNSNDFAIDCNSTARAVLLGNNGLVGWKVQDQIASAPGTTDASSVSVATVVDAGGLGVAKRSFLGTIGSTFKGNVQAGVQDATAAVAGQVGEVLSNSQSTYTNFTTTATYQQLATVTLTAGDWMEYATVTFDGNGATDAALTNSIATLCDTTASATGAVEGETLVYAVNQITSTLRTTVSFTFHENTSASKSKFLNGQMTFTAGNPRYVCSLKCVRIR